jgi:hypothetical protein
MNFGGHLIAATIGAVVTSHTMIKYNDFTPETAKIIIPAVILGANFPDTDTNSIPSKIYAALIILLSYYWFRIGTPIYIPFVVIPYILAKRSKHRGWTHSLWLPFSLFLISILFKTFNHFINIKIITGEIKLQSIILVKLFIKYQLAIESFSLGLLIHVIPDIISTYLKRRRLK